MRAVLHAQCGYRCCVLQHWLHGVAAAGQVLGAARGTVAAAHAGLGAGTWWCWDEEMRSSKAVCGMSGRRRAGVPGAACTAAAGCVHARLGVKVLGGGPMQPLVYLWGVSVCWPLLSGCGVDMHLAAACQRHQAMPPVQPPRPPLALLYRCSSQGRGYIPRGAISLIGAPWNE